MSITRLQQARQMYAQGQRVAKTLDGSRPGYRGEGEYQGGRGIGGSKSSNNTNNTSNNNNNNNMGGGGGRDYFEPTPISPTLPNNVRVVDTIMTSPNIGGTISTDPDDIREQYRVGNIPFDSSSMYINNPRAVGITAPYMTLGLEKQRKDNYIDRMNLQGSTYQPLNLPTLAGGVINFLGGLGFEKNKNFFLENVAGKYGYGYDLDAYKQYMEDRMAGKVSAYGNPALGQNTINAMGNKNDLEGITSISSDENMEDLTENMTDDELILRYLGADSTLDPIAAGVTTTDELRELMLERARNLYT